MSTFHRYAVNLNGDPKEINHLIEEWKQLAQKRGVHIGNSHLDRPIWPSNDKQGVRPHEPLANNEITDGPIDEGLPPFDESQDE